MRLPIWVAALLIPAVPLLQQKLDAWDQPGRRDAGRLLSAAQVRRLAPGFDLLMADLYWVRTVQLFGSRAFVRDRNLDLLRPMIEVTTDLDPRLEIAYRYGAVFLGDPEGAARPDDALAVLAKGVRRNPQSWKLRQEYGFYHFLYKNDAVTAARELQEAARLPGAPFWLETLGASLLRKGGHRGAAREMWTRLYEQAEAPAMKNNAWMHLAQLEALDQIEVLQLGIAEFQRRHGRLPHSLQELEAARLVRVKTVDPLGIPFRYDAQAGVVEIAPESRLPRQ